MPLLPKDKKLKRYLKKYIDKDDNQTDKDKMTPLMQAIKAVHSAASAGDSLIEEDLKRQRAGQDLFSKLATPPIGLKCVALNVGNIKCEWVSPGIGHEKKHIILYCHGGGYTCGSINYARILAGKLAMCAGMSVFSFEYRLAPENPFPAAIEDALAVWDHLMEYGFGAREIILAGDSAGGNLALELCLKLKSRNRLLPAGLVLMSPWTDMTKRGASYTDCMNIDPMITTSYIDSCRKAYAPLEKDFSRVEYSPLFADFTGFPPTLVQVGTNEILKSDSTDLVEVMQEAGVFSTLEIYEDSWHVFQMMPLKRAAKAMDAIGEFIHRII